jgi:hypothetical protein
MSEQATARARGAPDIGQALMDAAEAIADMARRVQLNGPEVTYASEKLGHALYKAAEGLALCGVRSTRSRPRCAGATSTACGCAEMSGMDRGRPCRS